MSRNANRTAQAAGAQQSNPTPPQATAGSSEPRAEGNELSAGGFADIIKDAVKEGVTAGVQAGMQMARAQAPQVEDEPPPPDPKEVMSEMEQQLAEPRFLVHITKGDKDSVDPVPVGVNGQMRGIKRGELAIVTRSMLEVLQNSEETHIDPTTQEPYQVTSYPYTVHCEVPKELWDLAPIEAAKKLMPDRNFARLH